MSGRRSYGGGGLSVRTDSKGRQTYYGTWYVSGRRVKRRVGLKRQRGEQQGLTVTQAETQLRRMIAKTRINAPAGERLTIDEASERYRVHLVRLGRKRTTVGNVEGETRVHLVPFFQDRSMPAISPDDVEDLITVLEAKQLKPKTIRNIIATLSALFNYAKAPRRQWATFNPCEGVDLPAVPAPTEIRFITLEEIDALVAHALPGVFHQVDAAMYRTAPMTGLRQGELIALRRMDVDWQAARIRVRRNYVLGEFGTPKSKRSSRSVPMADEVAHVLEPLLASSRWQRDEDLVFAHPLTGGVIPKPSLMRRHKQAAKAAGLPDAHRFHDLRHTFGTRMAGAGVPLRTLQEWMGHRDHATTQRYADYAPSPHEDEMIAAAWARATPTSPAPDSPAPGAAQLQLVPEPDRNLVAA